MAIGVREGLSATGTSTVSITLGAGTQVGDIVVVTQALCNGSGTPAHATTPSSAGTWVTIATANDSNNATIRAWYRFITVAGSQAVTLAANGSGYNGQTMGATVLSGPNASPLDGTPTTKVAGASATGLTLDQVTTTQANSLVLALYSSLQTTVPGSTTNYTPPSGMTELYDRANASGFAPTGAAYVIQATAGPSGNKSYTGPANSTRHAGILVAFKGAAVPAGSFLQFF